MKLPGYESAEIDLQKLRDYCLNPDHPVGKHKARVFRKKLGITKKDSDILRQIILQAIESSKATEAGTDSYGSRYRCDFEIVMNNHRETIVTIWIIRSNENHPSLVTCYLKT